MRATHPIAAEAGCCNNRTSKPTLSPKKHLTTNNVSGTIYENSRDGDNLAENPKNNAAPYR